MHGKISRQQTIFFLFSLLISGGIFGYLWTTISLDELLAIIRQIPLTGMMLFFLFSLTMSVFRTWRYLFLLHIAGHRVDKIPLFLVTLVQNFFSDLLPVRLGTLIFIYLARTRLRVSWSSASAGFAYSFIFDLLSLGFLILLATLAASGLSQHPLLLILAGLTLAALSGGILLLLPKILTYGNRLSSSLPFLSDSAKSKFHTASEALHSELLHIQQSGMFGRILMLSFGVRCSKYLALYVLLLALVIPSGYGIHDFPLAKVFFGLTAAEMTASLPISGIAGFGAYEGAWSLVFQLLGYSEKLSALTSISHHLLTQIYGYSIGALAFLLLLLPWPIRTDSTPGRKPAGAILFYLRAILLFLLPLVCSALTLISTPSLLTAHGTNPAPAANRPGQPPGGKVVFQRPDGIFTLTIGEKQERQLTTSGSYPRWSPDGKQIAFVDDNRIEIMTAAGENIRELARTAGKAYAVCFHPDGHSVLFTDQEKIQRVEIDGGKVTTVVSGNEFLELDLSHNGGILVATEKRLGGYRVVAFNLAEGSRHTISRGCSASISPDGRLITVNSSDHRELYLFGSQDNIRHSVLPMIEGKKFDNQFWSNNQDWLASKSEGDAENIYLHHIPSSSGFQITFSGHCDRPDYFLPPPETKNGN
jgi:uncharacterized membrane protein YbhN (UPF0104 family)